MKKWFFILIIAIIAAFAWRYRFILQTFRNEFANLAKSPVVEQLKENILAPPPLVGDLTAPSSKLTRSGVMAYTNAERRQNGNLAALDENQKLNAAAESKLKDMFKQQYFEHVSPEGRGPGDLAREVQYSYVAIGENLALGNFKNDEALVTAWMNSPGHRENILNTKYTQIGVAVGKGVYEGHTVWLAVQEFGRPASDCPVVDSSLKSRIASTQSELKNEEAGLEKRKAELDQNPPGTPEESDQYNQKVKEFNAAVRAYNAGVSVLKQIVEQYNRQVGAFNECVNK